MVKAIIVELEFFSTFSINVPSQTASPSPLPIPMPSTLVGALAASYFRLVKGTEVVFKNGMPYSSAAKLLWDGAVIYAIGGFKNPTSITFQDLARVIILPYQRRKTEEFTFAATGFGRALARGIFTALYLVSNKWADILSKAAWGITAVGNKESLTEVRDVAVEDITFASPEEGESVETMFYVEADIAECAAESCISVTAWPFGGEAYASRGVRGEESVRLKTWHVPFRNGLYGGYMKVRPIAGRATVLKISMRGVYEYVIIPRNLLSSSAEPR